MSALNEPPDRVSCRLRPEDGDETALACALYMATVAALSTVVGTGRWA